MIAEKPNWVRHEGKQIFSIDIQPGALRFATGGGDHKVCIWNMRSVSRDVENNETTQRLLATLRDHFGSVNCVRWAKHGRYLASGSDDQVILVHEKKPGSGTTEFGSGEPPDVENWKVVMTLRGHTADVVDLNWSPDDSLLASGSLDNTIHIWNMSNGICTAVLRGHSSLVKGVSWDPIGSFIASQSDDKTVRIWRTSDWSLAHRTDGFWAKSLESTFFRRLGWSPCGQFITTTSGFQKPRHSAPVLEREEWVATFDFLGHTAPIIVVKFNHYLFRRPFSNSPDVKPEPVGWTKGKIGLGDSQTCNVIAIGSEDRTVTVWTTASSRPLFVAKHFFTQSVVDLSWSPDGYSLFACSLDGTVATFHYDVKELGHKLSDVEFDELIRSRYGDVRDRQANLADTPGQLLLEAASVKETNGKGVVPDVQKSQLPSKTHVDLNVTAKLSEPQADEKEKANVAADGLNKAATVSARISSPVKQREYRRADGRKRIIPEPLGVSNQQGKTAGGGGQSNTLEMSIAASGFRKDENGTLTADGDVRKVSIKGLAGQSSDIKERSGVTAKSVIAESLVIEKVPGSAGRDGTISVDQAGSVRASSSSSVSSTPLFIKVFDGKVGEDSVPICLEARPREQAVHDITGVGNTSLMKETEIVCTRGPECVWSDRIFGRVTVLAGNANFWAVGCEDGFLQVYTKLGRRAMPTMMMGSAATFIDCDECWKLLLVTRRGSLYMWDILNRTCLLQDSLASLVSSDLNSSKGTIKVISAKLSKSGSPLVVLATRHAFLFDLSLKCWLRVADDCFPASNFASSWNLGAIQSGELAALQVDVRKYLARKPGWSRVTDDGVHTRAHLEAQLESSFALKSPNEYRQCLLSYVRFLAREADESRLREVCESFIGPPTGMAESTSSDAKNPAWDPCVLGMRKHKLLKEDILPAIATNRKVQRLLNEFMDLLSEYESPVTNSEPKNPVQPSASRPSTAQMDVDINLDAAASGDRTNQALPAANNQVNTIATSPDLTNSVPVITNEVNRVPETKADQVESSPMLSLADQVIPDTPTSNIELEPMLPIE